ncbi:hypothetical protein SAMN05192553_11244 [Cyclobacterium xiamenense]|uniref:SnoaL-like domain-containing protein n=1 Tax=Cyclobacterium xiamenense TaxID=1297121 RepID=A0A1H7BSK0_9BACT|nr:hypothetical protein [Cyclobacterium xiamenense]SEJ77290.1 hypothetical protein SAMN05192553_11244 [Cyclobacterium xiamenense]
MKNALLEQNRKKLLKKAAEAYFDGLRTKSFSLIPFSDDIIFRAPIAPGGVHEPIVGVLNVYEQWWLPLEPLLEGISVTVLDHFYNEEQTSIISRVDITLRFSDINLRVADRFQIDDAGNITEQENHFDASPLRR